MPKIIRSRIIRSSLAGAALLLVCLQQLLRSAYDNAAFCAALLLAVLFNAGTYYISWKKGGLCVVSGACIGAEERKGRLLGRAEPVEYKILLKFPEEEEQLIFLKESKRLRLRTGEVYEFVFRKKEELTEQTLLTFERLPVKIPEQSE
ncbi:MAG: hypothetical protein LIO67_05585 [Lachnospiraceae bacterium]|nr:hypothetical protein [Lachnospiraceae bacterium]